MIVTITLVPRRYIRRIWPQVVPLLLKGKEHWEERYSLDDIEEALLSNDLQLWAYITEKKIKCILLTSIIEYPQAKYLRYHYIGGSGLRVAWKYVYLIENWAKENGAVGFELLGRFGWAKIFNQKGSLWLSGKFKD